MILAAAVAAFFLVPVAHAAASTIKVKVNGSGSGKVRDLAGEEIGVVVAPPIDCPSACEGTLEEAGAVGLGAFADEGSEFAGWRVTKGVIVNNETGSCDLSEEEKVAAQLYAEFFPGLTGMDGICFIEPEGGEIKITATFNAPIKVTVNGSGSGKVRDLAEEEIGVVVAPPIDCPSACEGMIEEAGAVGLGAFADEGSEFAGWRVTKGVIVNNETGSCDLSEEEKVAAQLYAEFFPGLTGIDGICFIEPEGGIELTATFDAVRGEEVPPNRDVLTVTKSPSSSTGGGVGSVSSKPKGIKCGTACDEAVAEMYKESNVELTAKPSTGSTFTEWVGGDCNGSRSTTCTIGMDKDESTEAVFGGTSKTFTPAEDLTIEKPGSGYGTVKAAGLGCEADCSSTTVLYQGPVVVPKAKAGKTVILKQAPAFGSTFSGWSGCDSVTEAGECVVAMSGNKTVSAEYTALPNKVLTVNKSYAKGNGSVASKPKGIKCATNCTQAVAQMPEGASVELVAKPTTGTFVKWEGGDCNGSTNAVCVVTMNTNETTTAVFSDPGKAFLGGSEKTLTLNKSGSGYGTVKASGLTCELLCSSTSALYQGPIVVPKPKAGKVVVLKAISAPGSKAVSWTGCDSNPTPSECTVAMETNKTVTAKFDEIN